jgi:hypothetical protein
VSGAFSTINEKSGKRFIARQIVFLGQWMVTNAVYRSGLSDCPGGEGVPGNSLHMRPSFAHRFKGSVPVQAIDHRKRRCNQLSADSNQRDYALAA